MTKTALFQLFQRKRIPQGTGDALDLVACKRQIEMQPQLTCESKNEMMEQAMEYVGVKG